MASSRLAKLSDYGLGRDGRRALRADLPQAGEIYTDDGEANLTQFTDRTRLRVALEDWS